MYAIFEDRGSQYNVHEGDTLEIDRMDVPEDNRTIVFDRVLLVGEGEDARVGQPYLDNAKVTGTVQAEVKGEKIVVMKMKRRKGYRRKQGHRQQYLRIHIDKIEA
ncbi:MAG: 50S ribosomal protein L21 [bacterium]|nr:50S ribosomal protein L21 [bacterium]